MAKCRRRSRQRGAILASAPAGSGETTPWLSISLLSPAPRRSNTLLAVNRLCDLISGASRGRRLYVDDGGVATIVARLTDRRDLDVAVPGQHSFCSSQIRLTNEARFRALRSANRAHTSQPFLALTWIHKMQAVLLEILGLRGWLAQYLQIGLSKEADSLSVLRSSQQRRQSSRPPAVRRRMPQQRHQLPFPTTDQT